MFLCYFLCCLPFPLYLKEMCFGELFFHFYANRRMALPTFLLFLQSTQLSPILDTPTPHKPISLNLSCRAQGAKRFCTFFFSGVLNLKPCSLGVRQTSGLLISTISSPSFHFRASGHKIPKIHLVRGLVPKSSASTEL